jgi:hypothetical protein
VCVWLACQPIGCRLTVAMVHVEYNEMVVVTKYVIILQQQVVAHVQTWQPKVCNVVAAMCLWPREEICSIVLQQQASIVVPVCQSVECRSKVHTMKRDMICTYAYMQLATCAWQSTASQLRAAMYLRVHARGRFMYCSTSTAMCLGPARMVRDPPCSIILQQHTVAVCLFMIQQIYSATYRVPCAVMCVRVGVR